MSASAAEYVRSQHGLDRVADAYAAALEEVAAGETARAPMVTELPARSSGVPLGA
jgi:hypothetical protein